MFSRFLVFSLPILLAHQLVLADTATIKITEISPQTLTKTKEWFEFRVSGVERVDFTDWSVQILGKTAKKFTDFTDNINPGLGVKLSNEPLSFELSADSYFTLSPSPVSLPNDGASLQILDADGKVLTQADYPTTKSGTADGAPWVETWYWSDQENRYFPLQHSTQFPSQTPGQTNISTPTINPRILINEASPKNQNLDFVELIILSPELANLKGVNLKHNGTTLWDFDRDFEVKSDEFLVFYLDEDTQNSYQKIGQQHIFHTNKKSGLSSGSGTLEVNAWVGTSWEKTLDAWCWQKDQLSQTESSRVEKYREANHWTGPCGSIKNLIDNESIARTIDAPDANTKNDLFRHFNGSPGQENTPQNQPPTAVITVQGSSKISGQAPFYLNLSAEDSIDPDGDHDLAEFAWELSESFLSSEENPAGFYLQDVGTKALTLTVIDHSGATDSTQISLQVLPAGSAQTQASTSINLQQLQLDQTQSSSKKNKALPEHQAIITRLLSKYENLGAKPLWPDYEEVSTSPLSLGKGLGEKPYIENSTEKDSPFSQRQIKLVPDHRRSLSKNLSLIFTWDQYSWEGRAVE